VRIYRLEHRDTGEGIFHAFTSDYHADNLICKYHLIGPMPSEDGLTDIADDPRYRYGVARILQLHDWFTLAPLAKALPALVAAEYHVPRNCVKHGGNQVAYLAYRATKIRNIPWKELIRWHTCAKQS
jgi:hypothetical protein